MVHGVMQVWAVLSILLQVLIMLQSEMIKQSRDLLAKLGVLNLFQGRNTKE